MTDWSVDPGAILCSSFGNTLFVDVPGYGTAKHPTEAFLESFPFDLFDQVFLLVREKLVGADEHLVQSAKSRMRSLYVVQTHAKTLGLDDRNIRRSDVSVRLGIHQDQFLFIDNPTEDGFDELKQIVFPAASGRQTPHSS